MSTIKNTLSYQDDFNCVLQLAEDELAHLEHDAVLDPDSANDYLDSKAALERVRECRAQMELMTDAEYCKARGTKCPNCRSEDIEGGYMQVDGETAWQDIVCNSCGGHWRDLYSLIGFESV